MKIRISLESIGKKLKLLKTFDLRNPALFLN